MEEKLVRILNEMAEYLSVAQMKKLQEVLLQHLSEEAPHKENIENRGAPIERCNTIGSLWSICYRRSPLRSAKSPQMKYGLTWLNTSKAAGAAR